MKRIAVMIVAIVAMLSSVSVYADMGLPLTAEFTVAIGLDGCIAYEDRGELLDGTPTGHIEAGVAFYVYDETEGYYYGTTQYPKDPPTYEDFVYIDPADTMDSNEEVAPEVGEDTGYDIESETTDALNLRTGPGTGFRIKTTLKKGTKVKYSTTYQADGEWAYVSAGSDYGWVSVKYLKELKRTEKGAAVKNEEEPEEKVIDTAPPSELDGKSEAPVTNYNLVGIICICVGAALIIAAIAIYALNRRKSI